MKSRIICIGNRLLPEDAFGPAVFDDLQARCLPDGIEVVEGGTAGLNLLSLLDEKGRVIFVDTVSGFTEAGNLILLDRETVTDSVADVHFGHDPGLAYVLAVLPVVCEKDMVDEVFLIGCEGEFNDQVVKKAAEMSMEIAVNGAAAGQCIKGKVDGKKFV